MFKKKKKNEKEKDLNSAPEIQEPTQEKPKHVDDGLELIAGNVEETEEIEMSESERQKKEQLDSVKSKISRILKSGNIEIVDENIGDEYDVEEASDSEKRKQQDYDSLKAIFGDKNKNQQQELTLTIDDFDYTYVGKYLEEYDLIHKKNIKKIKLPSKALKIVRRVALVVALIGILIGGVIFAINFTKEPVYYLDSVALSQDTQTYFVEEDFDFTGLYLYLTYSNGRNQYTNAIPLTMDNFNQNYSRGDVHAGRTSITFKGGSEATLGFTYGGKICSMVIKIKRKDEASLTVKYNNSIFNLQSGDKITKRQLFALINFTEETDYNSELLEMKSLSISVNGTALTYSENKNNAFDSGFILNEDLNHNSKLTISYGDYSVELTYVEGAKTINEITSHPMVVGE